MVYRFSKLMLKLQVPLFGCFVPGNGIANCNVRVHMVVLSYSEDMSLTAAERVEAGSGWSQRKYFWKQDYTVTKMYEKSLDHCHEMSTVQLISSYQPMITSGTCMELQLFVTLFGPTFL